MSEVMRNSSTCLLVLMLAPVLFADDANEPKVSENPPAELSVAPLTHIDYPDDRPNWVNGSVDIDKDSVSIVVLSGPCETAEESIEELRITQRAVVSTFVSRLTESGQFDFYDISDEEIDRDLVIRRYSGTVVRGDMVEYEHAVELRFSNETRHEIQAAWKNAEVGNRLGAIGAFGFLGTVLLMCSSALIGVFSRRVERSEQSQTALT